MCLDTHAWPPQVGNFLHCSHWLLPLHVYPLGPWSLHLQITAFESVFPFALQVAAEFEEPDCMDPLLKTQSTRFGLSYSMCLDTHAWPPQVGNFLHCSHWLLPLHVYPLGPWSLHLQITAFGSVFPCNTQLHVLLHELRSDTQRFPFA